MNELHELRARLRAFAQARDWEQFHSPKNLSMALIVEVAELVEHFQWLTESQSARLDPKTFQAVEQEIADVFIYLVRLSDLLGIDLLDAAARKIALNERNTPRTRSGAKPINARDVLIYMIIRRRDAEKIPWTIKQKKSPRLRAKTHNSELPQGPLNK